MITALFSPESVKPRLFYNDQGDLFIKINVKGETLVRPIPPFDTREEAEAYVNKLVPEMAKELYRRRRNRLKRNRRKK